METNLLSGPDTTLKLTLGNSIGNRMKVYSVTFAKDYLAPPVIRSVEVMGDVKFPDT